MTLMHIRLFAGPVSLLLLIPFVPSHAQSSLAEHLEPVNSIAFDAPDDDLMPLVKAIGSSRIVVLGEATHSDGEASRAKARVARFLHERMGFTVLAWESGFLQSHGMNAALRDRSVPLDSATSFLMAGGWAWDADIQPLFSYARESWRTDHPLVMAGFDSGRPHRAAPYLLSILDDLFSRAPWLRPDERDRALIRAMAERGFGFLSPPTAPELRKHESAALQRLEARLATSHDSLRVLFSDRDLALLSEAIAHLATSEAIKGVRGVERAYLRDREIARQLRWILEVQYPGQKVIIWAATAHFIRNSDLISNVADSTLYVVPYEAGNHLAAWYGDDLYTIAFTSYGGEQGEVHPNGSPYESRTWRLEPAVSGSIEADMHQLGNAYAFLDIETATRAGAIASSHASVALGRLENVAPWARVIDAYFFLDRSHPVRNIH